MKKLLQKYESKIIALTFPTSKDLTTAVLKEVSETFFTIENKGLRHHFNYSVILSALDADDGIRVKKFKQAFPLILTMNDQVMYGIGSVIKVR
ncbi:hypothetical protein [Haloplasma contractile]|uniref:Uncharacterized protein n=1 Tax=Haloplasma contractile SSD-17B TaxID=1033810 RepID=F7Q1R9_9MOLU|nr:hypothetical protein [Haloplasma contractile]ERJ12268.1 hypothetical protein HLPCO_001795 [Haloplasma contractile SSD-17B]